MMDSVNKSYATALFELSKEVNRVEIYQSEAKEIISVLENHEDFYNILTNFLVEKEDKKQLLSNVFKNQIEDTILNFLKLLIDKSRFNNVFGILKEFNSLANEYRNIDEGIIYSAVSLSEEEMNTIENRVSKRIQRNVELTLHIDPSLIGGFKVVINDVVFDNSIKNKLESLKNNLKDEKVGG